MVKFLNMNESQEEKKISFKAIVRSEEFDQDWSSNLQKVDTYFEWKEGFMLIGTLHNIFKESNEIEDYVMTTENTFPDAILQRSYLSSTLKTPD